MERLERERSEEELEQISECLKPPSWEVQSSSPLPQRLAPLGAASSAMEEQREEQREEEDKEALQMRLKHLEEEQEELNTSLMAMTSHFAKVQLRLQQVVGAPSDRRDELLRELEHFAFRAIPSCQGSNQLESSRGSGKSLVELNNSVNNNVSNNYGELISRLKNQLEELESYAFESGEAIVPSNLLIDRQRVVLEQLKSRLNLDTDDLLRLSEEELKASIDSAVVRQVVNPLRMKSHLVTQLKTQIQDLEMFIHFLQEKSDHKAPAKKSAKPMCSNCNKNNVKNNVDNNNNNNNKNNNNIKSNMNKGEESIVDDETVSLLHRAMTLLHLSTLAQFGCGSELGHFRRNELKSSSKGNHYGDLRAHLELSVDRLLEQCVHARTLKSDEMADEEDEVLILASPIVTAIVRRELAAALRDLIQHGLVMPVRSSASLMPFLGCMSGRSASSSSAWSTSLGSSVHAWDVVMAYYRIKEGDAFNRAPTRKLSESFGLDLKQCSMSLRHSLLATIGSIAATHGAYKRSKDAHFKALVSAGLNQRKLIPWLKLVLRNQNILEQFYEPWSYVVKTGFDDSFRALERLDLFVFELPVNVAVRHFQEMNDAF